MTTKIDILRHDAPLQLAREQKDGSLCLKVAELADGYGSRESARKVRHVVENAIDNDRKFVTLDFAGVDRCSSAFVDELVAKLVAKYGVLSYTRFFKISNLVGLALGLANLSAAQRLSTPTPTPTPKHIHSV